ncbi:MAG: hypothetical protein LBG05_10300 [Treponema sp.]|jgi:hypothetical protein|nr:hypothetical protein [Treponema sp.]
MKRKFGLALLVFLAASGICFAQGFEIGASGFFASSDGASISGGGLNIAGTSYFSDVIGWGTYGNILYASYESVSIIVVDILTGPVFNVIGDRTFALPIAVGLYVIEPFFFGDDAAGRGFNIGVGGNITADISFGGSTYLYIRLQVAYEFLGGGETMITPSIGLGF